MLVLSVGVYVLIPPRILCFAIHGEYIQSLNGCKIDLIQGMLVIFSFTRCTKTPYARVLCCGENFLSAVSLDSPWRSFENKRWHVLIVSRWIIAVNVLFFLFSSLKHALTI
jgi:hypothetical protein